MLAPISLLAVGAVTLWRSGLSWADLPPGARVTLLVGALVSLPLGLYYLRTLIRGAKGAELWKVDVRYPLFVIYELGGFIGLGPSVTEIREMAREERSLSWIRHKISDFAFAIMAGAALSVVFYYSRETLAFSVARRMGAEEFWAVFLLGTMFYVVASAAAQKAFWARHYAPLFPFYVAGIALLVAPAFRQTAPWPCKIAASFLVIAWIVSSLRLRFASRHARDDYRRAAADVDELLLAGKNVWWVAGPEAAEYYGLPLEYERPRAGKVFCPLCHTGLPATRKFERDLMALPPPDFIVVSKPDSFDGNDDVGSFLRAHRFRPQIEETPRAFTFWRRPEGGSASTSPRPETAPTQ
jgi:hypothetical protein